MKNKLIAAFLVFTTTILCNENKIEYEIHDVFEFLSPASFVRQACLSSKNDACKPISYALFLQNQLGDLDRYFLENKKNIENYQKKDALSSKKKVALSRAGERYVIIAKQIENDELRKTVTANSSEIIQQFSSFKGTQEEFDQQILLMNEGLKNAYKSELQK